MSGTLTLRIITPDRVVFDSSVSNIAVEQVTATAVDGELSILPEHEPLVTSLAIDILRYKVNKEDEFAAVMGGILEVKNNEVTVLSDAAELDTDIDVAKAHQDKERAEAEKLQKTDKIDVYVAELAVSRAIARIKASEFRQRRRGRNI
ncbi:MAG: ATP synthase F1 subunit epsilon [Candidatus Obscuribacterales bacterium]|nr:ATP synthase F1 subunit epsilon [Candidatus Obscuribacterales bacterium]